MNLPEPVRRHPLRSLWLAALFCALFLAHPRSQLMYLVGFLLAAAGMALRVWSAGHPLGSRPPEAGPGRIVRHPAMFGALLAAAGFIVMCTSFSRWGSTLLLWAAFAAFLKLQALPAVEEKDRALAAAMGPSFARWAEEVPLLRPDARCLHVLSTFSAGMLGAGWPAERRSVWAAVGLAILLRFKMVYRL